MIKFHLACGNNILLDWFNFDFNEIYGAITWDLTQRFQADSDSVDLMFCEHFIEHITRNQAKYFLSECYRCLKPGGTIRLSTPCLDYLIDRYLNNDITVWKNVGWTPGTRCQMINEGFHEWGHKFLYNNTELITLFKESGFVNIIDKKYHNSEKSELCNLECRPYNQEIIIEATK